MNEIRHKIRFAEVALQLLSFTVDILLSINRASLHPLHARLRKPRVGRFATGITRLVSTLVRSITGRKALGVGVLWKRKGQECARVRASRLSQFMSTCLHVCTSLCRYVCRSACHSLSACMFTYRHRYIHVRVGGSSTCLCVSCVCVILIESLCVHVCVSMPLSPPLFV